MKKRRVYVGKNLSRREAWRRARRSANTKDFRGMKYNKATGIARLI